MRTIRELKAGDASLRLVEQRGRYVGLVITPGKIRTKVEGDEAEEVWRRLHDENAKSNPSFFGFSGARTHFLRIFPEGFATPIYRDQERNWKLTAKRKLDSGAPLNKALSGSGFGEAALAAFRATNLLSTFESTRIQAALRSPQADAFVRGAAAFALGEIEHGLCEMEAALKPHDVAKWTACTYLPFLWRPEEHMFLKPEVTRDFAERVGHPFAQEYGPALKPAVYASLLDLAARTAREVEELGARDHVDVQSFIWVVGKYTEDDARDVHERTDGVPTSEAGIASEGGRAT